MTSTVDKSILENKLGYRLRMLDRCMSKGFSKFVGLTQVQFSVFSLIATNQKLSQIAIGEALNMDKASTMAIINKLETLDLITKEKSEFDRRVHELHLSKKGLKEFPKINKRVMQHDDKFSKVLSASELKALDASIKKIISKQHV